MADCCLKQVIDALFAKRKYKPLRGDDVELQEHSMTANKITYATGNATHDIQNTIYFQKNGIGLGDNFIRYEYIPLFHCDTSQH